MTAYKMKIILGNKAYVHIGHEFRCFLAASFDTERGRKGRRREGERKRESKGGERAAFNSATELRKPAKVISV